MRQLRLIFLGFILVISACAFGQAAAHPDQRVDARQRIAELANATSLVRDGMKPWHLAMTFDLYDLAGKLKESGTLEGWWVSPTQFRIVIASPSFSRTIPGGKDADSEIANREAFLVSSLLEQVLNPIPSFSEKENLTVTEYSKNLDKIKLSCLTVSRTLTDTKGKEIPLLAPVFCLEPDSDILRTLFDGELEKTVTRNRAARFRDVNLGLDITAAYSGRVAITGKVVKLEPFDPEANPAGPLTATGPFAVIPAMTNATKIVKKVPPIYPEDAERKHISGTVNLLAVISREGKIKSLDIISAPVLSLGDAAFAAVRQWEFQPFLIKDKPTEVSTTITVKFSFK